MGCWVRRFTTTITTHQQHSLVNDVRQQTNVAWRANTMVQINAYLDDDHHRDRFRSSRSHRVREEDGDHAAAGSALGTPDLTARPRSSRPEV